jgi:sterol desaturase/sphingolipid hydroxylase (fatty acid hydroxylase superfamily)
MAVAVCSGVANGLPDPLTVWLLSYAVDLARYALIAGPAFLFFWVWGRERFRSRLVQGDYTGRRLMLHDLGWSMSTVLVFSLAGVAVFYGGKWGLLRRYESIAEHGWAWFALSVVLLIVLQDAYFYWTHRAMHRPAIFRAVHRVHHVSRNPSPWTAYAFSPIEAIVHALFVPLAWLVLPLHQGAVFLFLLFMVTRNVLGHLSIELYPRGFTRDSFWKWHTTTTHHALHHRHSHANFGLYFTFWDRLMGTTHQDYDTSFDRVAGARK